MSEAIKNRKTIKAAILSLLTIVIAIAVGFTAMNVMCDKEVLAASNKASLLKNRTMPIDSSEQNAAALYHNKINDINDTASIAKLLNAMKLESVIGKYTVQISRDDGVEILSLKVSDAIQYGDKTVFNANMEFYAQQMLALIPEIDRIEWSCPVTLHGSPEVTVKGVLSAASASEKLGTGVKYFGESQSNFHKLLIKQSATEPAK